MQCALELVVKCLPLSVAKITDLNDYDQLYIYEFRPDKEISVLRKLEELCVQSFFINVDAFKRIVLWLSFSYGWPKHTYFFLRPFTRDWSMILVVRIHIHNSRKKQSDVQFFIFSFQFD